MLDCSRHQYIVISDVMINYANYFLHIPHILNPIIEFINICYQYTLVKLGYVYFEFCTPDIQIKFFKFILYNFTLLFQCLFVFISFPFYKKLEVLFNKNLIN